MRLEPYSIRNFSSRLILGRGRRCGGRGRIRATLWGCSCGGRGRIGSARWRSRSGGSRVRILIYLLVVMLRRCGGVGMLRSLALGSRLVLRSRRGGALGRRGGRILCRRRGGGLVLPHCHN